MLCIGKVDSVCYRWMGGDIMSEEQILLRKSYMDYEISVKIFFEYKDTDDIGAIDIALFFMVQAIEKCLISYLLHCNIAFKRKYDINYLLMKCPEHLDCIPSIYKNAMEISLWEASTRYSFYEIEDVNLYYAILIDYCNLYNYVATLLDKGN